MFFYTVTPNLLRRGIASYLSDHFSVILTDLRRYGESSKPQGDLHHLTYSKMEMGKDQFEVMQKIGHDECMIVAHDRGARVAHRMALD